MTNVSTKTKKMIEELDQKIKNMTKQELIEEIQWIASIIADQPCQACYLADLAEALGKKVLVDGE